MDKIQEQITKVSNKQVVEDKYQEDLSLGCIDQDAKTTIHTKTDCREEAASVLHWHHGQEEFEQDGGGKEEEKRGGGEDC